MQASSFTDVLDLPDPSLRIVGEVQFAVPPLCEARGPSPQLRRVTARVDEALGKILERSLRAAVQHRLEHDAEALLWQRRGIPRSMERDERAVAISGRKRAPGIEQQSVRRPVSGKHTHRAALGFAPAEVAA